MKKNIFIMIFAAMFLSNISDAFSTGIIRAITITNATDSDIKVKVKLGGAAKPEKPSPISAYYCSNIGKEIEIDISAGKVSTTSLGYCYAAELEANGLSGSLNGKIAKAESSLLTDVRPSIKITASSGQQKNILFEKN